MQNQTGGKGGRPNGQRGHCSRVFPTKKKKQRTTLVETKRLRLQRGDDKGEQLEKFSSIGENTTAWTKTGGVVEVHGEQTLMWSVNGGRMTALHYWGVVRLKTKGKERKDPVRKSREEKFFLNVQRFNVGNLRSLKNNGGGKTYGKEHEASTGFSRRREVTGWGERGGACGSGGPLKTVLRGGRRFIVSNGKGGP